MFKPMRMAAATALLGLTLALAGCGGSGSGGKADAEVHVSLTEYKIEPADIKIPANKTVNIMVKNDGTMPHNLVINDLKVQGNMLSPGETQTITVKTGAAGKLEAMCGVAGHKEMGMKANVSVE
jgi:uncharacterized cupredoxin-like copper-binding protein